MKRAKKTAASLEKKLRLIRTTIADLTPTELERAAGGYGYAVCPNYTRCGYTRGY